MIYGDVARNETRTSIAATAFFARRFVVEMPGAVLARVALLLGADAAVAGQQSLWVGIYRERDLIASAGPVTVFSSDPVALREVDLPAGLALMPGTYYVGVYGGGGAGGVAQFAGQPVDRSTAAGFRRSGFTSLPQSIGGSLDDVPADPLPAVYVHAIAPYAPRAMPDEDVARLPFDVAQATLGASSPAPGERYRGRVGWHGVSVDDSGDATAIVRSDGPLAELVGERVRITRAVGALRRSVVVLVADEQSWPEDVPAEDLSVARRAWLLLGDWAIDDLQCTIEVLA